MTIRLPSAVKQRLQSLAEATSRSKSWLAADAICNYLDLEEWQIQETLAGLNEADQGDFASDEEVHQLLGRWIP